MRSLVIPILLACGIVDGCAPSLPPAPPVKQVRWLDQNWNPNERHWFHHASQGTSTFPVPYKWFVSLEQPKIWLWGDAPMLVDEEYLRQFGFIPSPRTVEGQANQGNDAGAGYQAAYGQKPEDANPDALPVGFAITKGYTDPTTGQPVPDQLGLSCAACHTGHLDYKGTSLRIDGGPATVDLGKFRTVLGLALAYTGYVPGRFDRFAERVLGPDATPAAKADLKTAFDSLLAKGKQVSDAEKPVTDTNAEEGFGRLDALTRIGNTVFAEDLIGAPATGFNWLDNFAPIVAPVKFPPTWDISWFDWVQYDASIQQPMIRNAGEAMGVNAKINLTNPDRPLYSSSVQTDSIFQMEQQIAGQYPLQADGKPPAFSGLLSPKWPEDVLGKIDPVKQAKGHALYQEICQGCHLPPVKDPAFWSPALWTTPNQYGQSYLKLKTIDLKVIGTDPGQADILPNRKVKLPAYLGVDPATLCNGKPGQPVTETLFAFALGYAVQKTVDTWYTEHKTPPATQAQMNGYRPNCLQAKPFYKARPLDGAWAIPPFLHNGSVPTLYDLLSPVAERPQVFCVGNREYDPIKVGTTTECVSGTTTIDTRIAGNHNTGHEFRDAPGTEGVIGRALSVDERWALIEYLKSL
jgi:mono/diheme cytochrome c family protein